MELLASGRPLSMGVLNVTPDSFSDGGHHADTARAVARAEAMCAEGADIIDIGGESARPGSDPVSLEEERSRVLPVIEALTGRIGTATAVSIDTSKPELMTEAVALGASLINDVRALNAPGAVDAAAASGAHVCLMHMKGEPRTMQDNPHYDDVVREVGDFLEDRVAACVAGGIERERILVDPGFGFGKTLAHNLQLLADLDRLIARLGLQLVAGMSRKRMIGTLLGDRPVDDRVCGSVAAAVISVMKGAAIVRVHDVAQTRDALAVASAVRKQEYAT